MLRQRWDRVLAGGLAAALAAGIGLADVQTASAHTHTNATAPSGIATVAQLFAPSYIFPFFPPADATNASEFMQAELYRPLYYTPDNQGTNAVNPQVSAALPPVWKNGGRTAVITLKNWSWSNGEQLDAKDLMFFLNMFKAEKQNYGLYIPGEIPDNIVSYKATGPRQVTITFNQVYSQQFLVLDQLSELTPMPMAWDMVSKNTAGDCDVSVSGCAAVYKYLLSQAKTPTSYPSNPLWQVVDGPWKLTSFGTDGSYTIVPNPTYGGDKAKLAEVKYETFTNETSEYNVLRSGGQLDVGFLPLQDAAPKPANATGAQPRPGLFDRLDRLLGCHRCADQFQQPQSGPIFRQTYIRQAMQMTVNQPGYIRAFLSGYGSVQPGPVPTQPPSPFQAPIDRRGGPLPFNLSKAASLLKAHGWSVKPNSADTCVRPGSGRTDCGAGIVSGATLSFTADYVNSPAWIGLSMAQWKSDASKVGIVLSLSEGPFSTVYGAASPCQPKQPACSWQIANFDGVGNYTYPVGALYFSTSGALNYGHYIDPVANSLIEKTITSSSPTAMQAYDAYLADQVPMIWFPMPVDGLDEVSNSMHGVIPSTAAHGQPVALTPPEYWSKS